MIADWLLIVLVFAVLWVFWQLLQFTFSLIERAQGEAMSTNRETEKSESS